MYIDLQSGQKHSVELLCTWVECNSFLHTENIHTDVGTWTAGAMCTTTKKDPKDQRSRGTVPHQPSCNLATVTRTEHPSFGLALILHPKTSQSRVSTACATDATDMTNRWDLFSEVWSLGMPEPGE